MKKTVILISILVLVATACSTRSEQANTVGSAAPTVTVEAPESTAGRVLTNEEIALILPDASDVGPDWQIRSTQEGSSTTEDNGTFSNPECERLLLSINNDDDSDYGFGLPVAQGSATFGPKSDDAFAVSTFDVSISSYEDTVPDDVFDAIINVFDTCNHFTTTSDGVTATFDVLPLSMPNYGDTTFAMKIQGGVGAFIFVADLVLVAVGHNIISASNTGFGGLDSELLPRVLELTINKLAE